MSENIINFVVALRRIPPLSDLTGDEERLLFELKTLKDDEPDLTVAGVYHRLQGRPASMKSYHNFTGLKEKGLVEVAVDQQDGGKRKITFTWSAERLFKKLGA